VVCNVMDIISGASSSDADWLHCPYKRRYDYLNYIQSVVHEYGNDEELYLLQQFWFLRVYMAHRLTRKAFTLPFKPWPL
jgi:hypothetical protein